jgi:hypothetical protein
MSSTAWPTLDEAGYSARSFEPSQRPTPLGAAAPDLHLAFDGTRPQRLNLLPSTLPLQGRFLLLNEEALGQRPAEYSEISLNLGYSQPSCFAVAHRHWLLTLQQTAGPSLPRDPGPAQPHAGA